MAKGKKTHEQMLEEIAFLKKRISELEISETRREIAERGLRESENRYRRLVEISPDAVVVHCEGKIVFMNSPGARLLGAELPEHIIGRPILDFTHPDYHGITAERVKWVIEKEMEAPIIEQKFIRLDGKEIFGEIAGIPFDFKGKPAVLNVIRDITQRKQMDEALRVSERKYRELVENANSIIMKMDQKGNITFFNEYAQNFFGFEESKIIGKNIVGTIVPETETSGRDLKKLMNNICSSPEKYQINENENVTKGEERVFVSWTNKAIYDNEEFTGVLCVGNDITQRKRAEEKLAYLSLHDPLTGVNNRTYFEQKMKIIQTPAGIIICDVDGLKLVNDTLGHDKGDQLLIAAAGVIKECFRGDDVVARIGGDEFAVLLSVSDTSLIERIIRRIREFVGKYNIKNPDVPLGISIGFATTGESTRNMNEIFKEADNNMYRDKLQQGKSARSFFAQALLKALHARKLVSDAESSRLQQMAEALGRAIGLTEQSISDLKLLAKFHDIGMVGIHDNILLKPERLTSEERKTMQRHCEIGHRIALSVPELTPIAGWILAHHEWWNGKGYPNSLEREEIPIECRIVAIAEAYDAMTHDRPYRKATTQKEAVEELKRCAGSQFDPPLVTRFIEVLENKM